MALVEQPPSPQDDGLVGTVPPSPAGPIDAAELAGLSAPPRIDLPGWQQTLRFNQRQIQFVFGARRRHGETFVMHSSRDEDIVITSHPDHARSLFTAKVELVPSLTAESPLRPIVGPNSVLTANGPRHLRQRRLLLPAFHGEAVELYSEMIRDAAEREIARWPVGRPFALAPRMQAITLDVIMAGIFGIEGRPEKGTPEHGVRQWTRRLVDLSTKPIAQLAELANIGAEEPRGLLKVALAQLDRPTYAVIRARRADTDLEGRMDILSMLLRARDEDGEGLTDEELRDELLTLVLAGHETTANSLAWAWERLVRTPDAYERLRSAVLEDDRAADHVEATIVETMRSRPVVPMVGRRVQAPWQLGEHGVPAESAVTVSILLLHHREDLYPEPFAFRPERFLDRKPGTYEWIPFGGGTRRCLGASLAMAEQRVVLDAMVRAVDLEAADSEAERVLHRNVTMIPAKGAEVIVRARR